MATNLDKALETIISTFHGYSRLQDGRRIISPEDLEDLLHSHLPTLSLLRDREKMNQLLQRLQKDGETGLDFQAFYTLIVGLIFACNECYEDHVNKQNGGITASKDQTS
uniref:protein S100-A1-like n=1 Tax=Myxine glutinosa TaxID=7769 RepID=UPI00358DFE32